MSRLTDKHFRAANDFRPPMRYCNGKPCYEKRSAVTAKNRRWKLDHVDLRVYHCNDCNNHHLTSQIKTKKNETKKKKTTGRGDVDSSYDFL